MQPKTLTLLLTLAFAGAACTDRQGAGTRTPPPGSDAAVVVDGGAEDSSTAGPVPLCTTESGCEPRFFVFNFFDVGMVDPEGDPDVVSGTNVDDVITAADADPSICTNKKDFKSPPPDNESGVDNQFGQIISSLSATGSFDVSANIESSIAAGALLVLLQVDGVDDPVTDPHIEVSAFSGVLPTGVAMPTLDSDRRLAPGQTFDIDAASLTATGAPKIIMKGSIDLGRVRARADALPLFIALGPGITLRLNIRPGDVRFTLGEAGLSDGVIGGGLKIDEVVEGFDALMVEGISGDLLEAVLMGAADLEPDSDGFCGSVSTGFLFEGVPAIRGLN